MRTAVFLLSFSLSLASALTLTPVGPSTLPLNSFGPSRLATGSRRPVTVAAHGRRFVPKIEGLRTELVCPPDHLCRVTYTVDVDENHPNFEEYRNVAERLEEESQEAVKLLEQNARMYSMKRWFEHFASPNGIAEKAEWALHRANLEFRDMTIYDAENNEAERKEGIKLPEDNVMKELEDNGMKELKVDLEEWKRSAEGFKLWAIRLFLSLESENDPKGVKYASKVAFAYYRMMKKIEAKYEFENNDVEQEEENTHPKGDMAKYVNEWKEYRTMQDQLHPFGTDDDDMMIVVDFAMQHWERVLNNETEDETDDEN